jgi:3-methyl-2-oxobutanoate hydroxymethyltransferase
MHVLGGFKVQAKSAEAQELLLKDAKDLEQSGCFSIVLECVPNSIAYRVTESLKIPVIGIGAGAGTDGQILVWHDLLGIQTQYHPKFVRSFGSLDKSIVSALNLYHQEVISGNFPSEKESYGD